MGVEAAEDPGGQAPNRLAQTPMQGLTAGRQLDPGPVGRSPVAGGLDQPIGFELIEQFGDGPLVGLQRLRDLAAQRVQGGGSARGEHVEGGPALERGASFSEQTVERGAQSSLSDRDDLSERGRRGLGLGHVPRSSWWSAARWP